MTTHEHRYQSCRDPECERPYCQIWKTAFAEGYGYGFDDGYAAGARAGAQS